LTDRQTYLPDIQHNRSISRSDMWCYKILDEVDVRKKRAIREKVSTEVSEFVKYIPLNVV